MREVTIVMKTKKMVMSAIFAALTFVATMVIQIRLTANGYVNIGDCMTVISGIFLGPFYGALAAGIGSVLADIITGYFIYAPVTFFVKALMAFLSAVVFRKINGVNKTLVVILCSLISETIMVLGYFFYEIAIVGLPVAVLGMNGNFLQAGFGVVCTTVLFIALSKNKYIKNQISY